MSTRRCFGFSMEPARAFTPSSTTFRAYTRVEGVHDVRSKHTAELLLNAASGLIDEKPALLVDGGVENFNSAVDELVDSGLLKRLLAMTDISFSNSLIESWWRALKHQWLFLNTIDTVTRLEKLVAFYVHEHNTRLPHSAFRGQTPDEMYFSTGAHIPLSSTPPRKSHANHGWR